jgi:hypothetical protein
MEALRVVDAAAAKAIRHGLIRDEFHKLETGAVQN